MARKIFAPVLLALVLLLGAFLFVPATPTAVAEGDLTGSPAVAEEQPAPAAEGEDITAYDETVHGPDGDTSTEGDGDAVPVDSEGEPDAVPSDAEAGADSDTDRAVPATDSDTDRAVPATGDDQDGTDPDALPADAPRVCVILGMGAAACESFVNPPPGEVSVAVIYSDDDERAIVETIAYDEHGPIDYVDFWEGETTPSE